MSRMQYRKLPHGEEQISILGLGTSSIQEADEALSGEGNCAGEDSEIWVCF